MIRSQPVGFRSGVLVSKLRPWRRNCPEAASRISDRRGSVRLRLRSPDGQQGSEHTPPAEHACKRVAACAVGPRMDDARVLRPVVHVSVPAVAGAGQAGYHDRVMRVKMESCGATGMAKACGDCRRWLVFKKRTFVCGPCVRRVGARLTRSRFNSHQVEGFDAKRREPGRSPG